MGATLLLVAAVAACAPSPAAPRSALEFMEDGLAREGVLVRCNRDRDSTLDDVECANARRAAAALAIDAERSRAGALERQSERKLAALREVEAREAAAARNATTAERAAAHAAYEAQWPNGQPRSSSAGGDSSGVSFGAPLGSVLPSISESARFDVYADGEQPLARPNIEVADIAPPANDIQIIAPQIEIAGVGEIPRPFRNDDANAPR